MGILDLFKPKPRPFALPHRTAGELLARQELWARASSTAETFHFRENLVANGSAPRFAQRVPPAGHACVEVLDADGNVLAMDTFPAPAAPSGAYHVCGRPATFVVDGKTGRAQQEFTCSIADCPVPLPGHIANRSGTLRVWWNCEQ